MTAENYESDDWLREELDNVTEAVGEAIARRAKIKIGKKPYPWTQISYCEDTIEPLLDAKDVRAITGGFELLPKSRQDQYGRWRLVLDDNGSTGSTLNALIQV